MYFQNKASRIPSDLCPNQPPENHLAPDKNHSSDANAETEQRWKILIAEDEVLVAENMREILEAADFIVSDVLSTGDDVIAEYASIDPDLIIMDVKLPGRTDGIEAAAQIHMNKEIPVIFLTAYPEDQFAHISFLSKNTYRYINKPFDLRKLPEFIQNFRTELEAKADS